MRGNLSGGINLGDCGPLSAVRLSANLRFYNIIMSHCPQVELGVEFEVLNFRHPGILAATSRAVRRE